MFFWGVVFFLPPLTQINIVLCHANGYISLPCLLALVFRKSYFLGCIFLFLVLFFMEGGGVNGVSGVNAVSGVSEL